MNLLSTQTQNILYELHKNIDSTSNECYSVNATEINKSNEESYSITTGNVDHYDNYLINLPDKINIFKKCNDVEGIKDIIVKKQVEKFLRRLQLLLMINKDKLTNIGNLPQLSIVIDEDESVLVEWMFKDFRIGFSFEKDEQESMWYMVSNRKFNEVNESGNITDKTIDDLLINILAFVTSHI